MFENRCEICNDHRDSLSLIFFRTPSGLDVNGKLRICQSCIRNAVYFMYLKPAVAEIACLVDDDEPPF